MNALALIWGAFVLSPALILAHSEYYPAGPFAGWQFATLSPGGVLYAWTRNRIAIWLLLYASGWLLLALGRRRDPDGKKLRAFAAGPVAPFALPCLAVVLLVVGAVTDPADLLLLTMMIALVVLGLWVRKVSGAALERALGRLMLSTMALLFLAVAGELFLRSPAMLERTGGSNEIRYGLRDRWERKAVPERNGLLWRSRHLYEPKPPGVRRILVLGDSFTFGDFIDDPDQLWPNVLEDALTSGGSRVQVINTATAGSDTISERSVLATLGWQYEPDVVILQYTLNDVGFDPAERRLPLVPILGSSWKAKSCLYRYLDAQFSSVQSAFKAARGWSSLYAEDSPDWARGREALAEIQREASRRGVPVVLLLFPMFDSDLSDRGYRNLEAHRAIARCTDALGMPCTDVRNRLAEIDSDPRSWWVLPFDPHPNAKAHRIAGEMMAAQLTSLGLITADR